MNYKSFERNNVQKTCFQPTWSNMDQFSLSPQTTKNQGYVIKDIIASIFLSWINYTEGDQSSCHEGIKKFYGETQVKNSAPTCQRVCESS